MLVRNPLEAAYNETAYRTGDQVTLDEEANYVFLGRRDTMVKTRGYRVELGEVESVLYEHPAVREAVVLPVPDEFLGNRLRAVICVDGEHDLSREAVLEHCRRRLPGYMLPDVIEFRAALPRTSNSKVDRVGLSSAQDVGTQSMSRQLGLEAKCATRSSGTTSAGSSSKMRRCCRWRTRRHSWTEASLTR